MTESQSQLLGQIIEVLCECNALMSGGNCVRNPDLGKTQPQLLLLLQTSFPSSNWTNDLSISILSKGTKCGALKKWNNPSTGQDLFFINLSMVKLNPINEQYRSNCSAIYVLPHAVNQNSIVL